MMGRKFLYEKIEFMYSRQFSALLRQKNIGALDFSKLIRKELRKQFKATPNYWIQSLANIIYSSHKFSEDFAEVSFFLRFLRSYKSFEFLFYLYIRQQFINICKISFINHFKSPKDFKKISISKSKAIEILKRSLSENPEALNTALNSFQLKYKNKGEVHYYQFLVFCLDIDINHSDLEIMDKIIQFYSRRPNLRSPSNRKQDFSEEKTLQEHFMSEKRDEIQPDETIKTELKTSFVPLNQPSNERYSEQEEFEEPLNNRIILQQQFYPTESDRIKTRKSEFPTSRLRQVYGKNLKEKELILTESIKTLLREEINKMLDNFISTFQIDNRDTEMISKSLFELILTKCKTILTMIFFQNRKRFFNIIRKNPKKEKELVQIWEELANMYDYFKKHEVDTVPVLRQFVKRCLMFPTLQEEILFLLQYMFKVNITRFTI